MFKNKHFAFFALLFSFIAGCKLFFTDDIQKKSAKLLDNVNSMILNPSEKKDFTQNTQSNNTSTTQNTPQNSQQLPNTIENTIAKEKESPKEKKTEQPETSQNIKDSELVSDTSKSITENIRSKTIPNTDKGESLPTTTDTMVIDALKNPLPKIELSGKTNNLSSISGESSVNYNTHNIDYDIYNHNIPKTTASSGSNSGTMTVIEDEFQENDDQEETGLDNQSKFNLNKTKDSINKAIKLVEQIKENANSFEFHNTMILYGIRTNEIEKNKHKEEIKKFTKEKLKNDLQKLLNELEESSNLAEKLYAKTTQKLQAQNKLNTLKIELNSIISKVQNQSNDNEAYKEIKYRSSFKNLQTNLETVISLLDGTTGAR